MAWTKQALAIIFKFGLAWSPRLWEGRGDGLETEAVGGERRWEDDADGEGIHRAVLETPSNSREEVRTFLLQGNKYISGKPRAAEGLLRSPDETRSSR